MKKVFSTTREVCQAWAAQKQIEGSHLRFRGDTLYHYGTAIARILAAPNGPTVALISSLKHSSGTSKVQDEAWGEANTLYSGLVFTVPNLAGDGMHGNNIRYFVEQINDTFDKLQRGHPASIAAYRRTARRIIATARMYAKTFGIPWLYAGLDPDEVKHVSELAPA